MEDGWSVLEAGLEACEPLLLILEHCRVAASFVDVDVAEPGLIDPQLPQPGGVVVDEWIVRRVQAVHAMELRDTPLRGCGSVVQCSQSRCQRTNCQVLQPFAVSRERPPVGVAHSWAGLKRITADHQPSVERAGNFQPAG